MNSTGSNRIPRGIPYQAPQPVPAAPPPWRPSLRQLLLGAAGAVLLVVVVAGAVYWSRPPASPPPAAGQPAPAAPKAAASPAVDAAPKPNERLLEMLGSLSTAHLHQSYLNIGMVADAVENETYTEAQGREMLATVAGLMDVVDRQLARLAKMELNSDDKEAVQHIRNISSLMRVQLVSLQAYWETGESKHAKRYHQAHEQAWKALSEVLGPG
jgi:hypothetical protein